MSYPREYYLGSGFTKQTFWSSSVKRDIIVAVVTMVLAAVLAFTRHVYAPLVVMGVGAAVIGVMHVGAHAGVSLGDRGVFRLMAGISRLGGIGRFTRIGVPWFARDIDVCAQTPQGMDNPGGATPEVAVQLLLPAGVSFKVQRSALATTVVGLGGSFAGLDDWAVLNGQARMFGALQVAAGNPRWGIKQIDFATRISPADLSGQAVWDNNHGGGSEAGEMRAIVGADATKVESWLAITCQPRPQRGSEWLDAMCDGAWDTTVEIVRQARAAGLNPYRVLSPRRLAATWRSLLYPERQAGDMDGIDGPWSGVPGLETTTVAVTTSTGWWHSIAVIDKNGWPQERVGPDFLDPLLGTIPAAPYRLVVTQLGMMSRREAQDKARTAGAVAGASLLAEEKASDFTTGETRLRVAGAESMLDELLAHGVGTLPVLRVMVSARSLDELMMARQAVRETLDMMSFTGEYWCDGWQARALGGMMLMGRGLK